ncbi:STAS-like domain-containing protein [Stappia indica]|uniref:DUF4325 domain-containing protein n=1 Tax=Stappia indica TaxID=538381 RepID=A0A857C3I8_9HYPH|nr:DUF4325 domain-containing protein [Stappia indica]QGZ33172.1 DUF4325 domain-containing protein [Stappia indica]
MKVPTSIRWENNTINLKGTLASRSVFHFSSALHQTIIARGYKDISLNFTEAYPVRESFMIPAIALIRHYRRDGIDFSIVRPENAAARNIFHNANWAYLINETENEASTFEDDHHLPASRFLNSDELTESIDRIMSMILKTVPLKRRQIAALEWSVNEITDNVLNHANSPTGGVIQASTIKSENREIIEFVVADAGIGIKRSLGEKDDRKALERAIKEGVTRNPATNQGNGLYGAFRVATLSHGKFELISGKAILSAEGTGRVKTVSGTRLYPGTAVICRVECGDEKLIENALMFKEKIHEPGFDYLERQHELGDREAYIFSMSRECKYFGSREAGIGARLHIENLIRSENDKEILVDFTDITIISSSFADEVFGRLFVLLGPLTFMSRIKFQNVDSSIRAVIDRAIAKRMIQSAS